MKALIFMVGGGTLTINSEALVSDASLTISGSGNLVVEGAAQFNGTFTQSGGTLAGSGSLTLAGTGSRWTKGTMTGGDTTRIAAGADLTLTTRNQEPRLSLGNRTLENDGTLIQTVSDNTDTWAWLELDGVAVLNNRGMIDLRGDNTWQRRSNTPGSLTLNNSGTLTKSAGSGSFTLSAVTLNNSGTEDVHSGRLFVSGVPFNWIEFQVGQMGVFQVEREDLLTWHLEIEALAAERRAR